MIPVNPRLLKHISHVLIEDKKSAMPCHASTEKALDAALPDRNGAVHEDIHTLRKFHYAQRHLITESHHDMIVAFEIKLEFDEN